MFIYIISLKTTGEVWHICVVANRGMVSSVLAGHKINHLTYGEKDGDFQEWQSASDPSQTATVLRQILIGWKHNKSAKFSD